MQHRLFGGLTVSRDGRPVELGGRKQRAVLAALLLDVGRVVPTDRLIDRVWADASPPRARASLQSYVSNLRRALEPDRLPGTSPSTLVTDLGGYQLTIARSDVDLTRFDDLCDEGAAALASGNPTTAADLLERALGLWGPLLPELAGEPWVIEHAARLDTRRAAAIEHLAEARLALGHHHRAISDLEDAVVAYPYRERLRVHLALALYRDGRQTEALRSLADARRTLADDIGVDPGPELAALEADILAHAPHLLAPTTPTTPTMPTTTSGAMAPAGGRGMAARASAATAPVAGSPSAPGGAQGRPARSPDDAGSEGTCPPGVAAASVAFVGRDHELADLIDAARAAAAGAGRAVVVGGEPGIGKTRLVEEVVARCGETSSLHPPASPTGQSPPVDPGRISAVAGEPSGQMVVAWARCTEGAAEAPFWVMAQIREQLVAARVLDDDVVARFDEVRRSARGDDPTAERLAVHRAAVSAFRSTARPLLIVVDDLQWADPSSLRSIELLAGDLRTLPMLLVATVRPLDLEPPPQLVACLGELARQAGAHRIDLTGLSEAAVTRWLHSRHRAAVPVSMSRMVHERTGGNPFFVGEVVELLARQRRLGDDGPGDLGVPAAVHDVVRRRVELLPAATQRLLSTASILGDAIDIDLLARVAGQPVDEALDAIAPALVAGLLVEDRSAPGRLRFTHSLVADALATELSLSRRVRLHAAATEALEALRGADLDRHLAELIRHASAGAVAGTARKAVDYAARAARLATAHVAHEDAAAHWASALAVLDLARPDDKRVRYDVLVELGRARRRADDLVGSQAVLLDAVALAEALDDDAAALRAAASLPHATLWQSSDYGSMNPRLITVLERLITRLGDAVTSERADILAALADAVYYADDPGWSARLSAKAVEVARQTGDAVSLARALAKRCQVLTRHEDLPVRRQLADELVAVAELEALPADLACVAHFIRSAAAFEGGERKTFETDLARAKVLAEQSGTAGLLSQIGWFETTWLLTLGRYAEAERCATETHLLHRRTRGWGADDVLASNLIAIAHDQGRFDDVVDQFDGLIDGDFGPAMRELVAWILTEEGRLDEARRLLGPVGSVPDPPDDWLWPAVVSAAAHVRAALGDAEACEVLYQWLLPSAGRLGVAGAGGPLFGAIDLTLGRLAAVLGDEAAARQHVAAGIDLLERFDARPWLARGLVTHADVLVRRAGPGDDEQAMAAYGRARVLATELALAPVLRALEDRGH